MEFSGNYLTYEEYKALGGTIDLTLFNILEFEARRKIDIRTQNRLKNVNDIPQEVKLCVFNMINSIMDYSTNKVENGNIASENIDGYSVTYLSPTQVQDVIKSKSVELNDIIDTWIIGVVCNGQHIAYLGVQ